MPQRKLLFRRYRDGHDVADFLLGAPSQYIQASLQVLTPYPVRRGFAQDSWRVKPNFTLNYGLRWEVSMPWYDTQTRSRPSVPGVQSTVFPGAPKGWLVPGDPGLPGGGPIPRRWLPPRGRILVRGSAWLGRRLPEGCWARYWAARGRPRFAPRWGSTTPPFRTRVCSSKWPMPRMDCIG